MIVLIFKKYLTWSINLLLLLLHLQGPVLLCSTQEVAKEDWNIQEVIDLVRCPTVALPKIQKGTCTEMMYLLSEEGLVML
jgi:hypothetical protein